ncbi:MAG: glycosyltransferase family 4 protein [Rhodovulum sp.]|nr:glycosyltransferase family 4 protein [Rhodovulum sp.]
MTQRQRILFDLTTTMRWAGPPVGILRAEGELARFARRRLPHATFVFFDPDALRYVALRDDVVDAFLDEDALIDTATMSDATRRRRRKIDRIPPRLRPLVSWVLRPRHRALLALEQLRHAVPAGARDLIARLQQPLMAAKDRPLMVKPDSSRRWLLTPRRALGQPIAFHPDDILVCAGTGWTNTNIEAIARKKADTGFRLVWHCYDIMPLTIPDCFQRGDVEAFAAYAPVALAAADLVVVNARRVEQDIRDWCAAHGLPPARTAVVPLGADGPPRLAAGGVDAPQGLPDGLEAGRYALFVSTIEPRKNHRLLVAVWRRLLDAGVPQATGFKLVFVGRTGWKVDGLMQEIAGDPRLAGTLIYLPRVEDAAMTQLFGKAAFCCYPSRDEGYGLPVVEAFRFGKPVLASTGGALPEVVGEFSPCLDPDDVDGWTAAMRRWIEEPAARAPYEERIRTGFRHVGWEDAAASFFAQVHALVAGAPRI